MQTFCSAHALFSWDVKGFDSWHECPSLRWTDIVYSEKLISSQIKCQQNEILQVRGKLTFREGHCEAIYETGLLVALDLMVGVLPTSLLALM